MDLEGTVDELMYTIHAHPTLGESMLDAYGAVEGMAIIRVAVRAQVCSVATHSTRRRVAIADLLPNS